jgi:hypothetical protein
MSIAPDTKIWKYMDLGKFLALLTTRTLYFACPIQFADPYEGWLPKSHLAAHSKIISSVLDQYRTQRDQFITRGVPERTFDDMLNDMTLKLQAVHGDVITRFGVCCWHEAEHESDAMWRIYAARGSGIAIESTIDRLQSSLSHPSLIVDRIRYMDFERDPIEKGHQHYQLFVKRQSFDYEREVRATTPLQQPGRGTGLPCDLDILISRIRVSPLEADFVADAIRAISAGRFSSLRTVVEQSRLYSSPNFGVEVGGE